MKYPLYVLIARTIDARARCEEKNNQIWLEKHRETLKDLESKLPSGSGIDIKPKIDFDSSPNKIIINFSFHHMDENGMYSGWTDHSVIIVPDLMFGFSMKITGKNKNQIKEYLFEVFDNDLRAEFEWV